MDLYQREAEGVGLHRTKLRCIVYGMPFSPARAQRHAQIGAIVRTEQAFPQNYSH